MEISKNTLKLINKIWDYHHLNHKLEKADCIIVIGGHDMRVAEYGAQLFLDGWAPLIIFSGGLGRITETIWNTTEADRFAAAAKAMGVPEDKILIENKSTNTGENILFTIQLLKEKGLNPQKFILVHKPYMERRSFATFKKLWPEKEVIVTSPDIKFEDYHTPQVSTEENINVIVGDLQRIKVYAEKGYQVPQEIPDDVWNAYEQLVKLGYDKYLVRN